MKKLFFPLFLVLLCLHPAYAALQLQLTQGMSAAIPIAIVPFAGQNYAPNDPTNMAAIIQNDLQNSGQFKVMPVDTMQQQPQTLDAVNYNYWQKANMNNLVIGRVQAAGGSYRVNFSLLDTYQGSQANGHNPVLFSHEYVVPRNQLRYYAHVISDAIYEQLTGKRGVFETHVAYVLKEQSGANARHILVVADADGFNPRPIVISKEPIMSPAWSPDGRRIAYVSFEKQRSAIYVNNVASGARQLISSYPGMNSAPAWSPDGSKLALVLSETGTPKIYILDLASRQRRQVTTGLSMDTEPSWAPDGNSLLFTSDRSGGPQVYRVNLGDGSVRRVTYDGNYNATASFTPDGKKIVLLHDYDIAVQDVASGGLSALTSSGNDSSPSVAPNGQVIIYANSSGDRGILGIVSIDGKIKLRLPAPEGSVTQAAWSPFS